MPLIAADVDAWPKVSASRKVLLKTLQYPRNAISDLGRGVSVFVLIQFFEGYTRNDDSHLLGSNLYEPINVLDWLVVHVDHRIEEKDLGDLGMCHVSGNLNNRWIVVTGSSLANRGFSLDAPELLHRGCGCQERTRRCFLRPTERGDRGRSV